MIRIVKLDNIHFRYVKWSKTRLYIHCIQNLSQNSNLLQIKKCNNSECTICLPVELPIEVFDELHFLPDPEPSIGKNYTHFLKVLKILIMPLDFFILADPDHYKDFSSIYGTQTSEKFRPSKAGQPEADNLPQGIFNNNRVREFVECDFCGKI